jgi:ankyrin repeat protein
MTMQTAKEIGTTPLHLACYGDSASLVELLVKFGADPLIQLQV